MKDKEPVEDMPPGAFFIHSLGSKACKYCEYKVALERPDYDEGMRVYQMVAHYAIRHPESLSYVVLRAVAWHLEGKGPELMESLKLKFEQAVLGDVSEADEKP